MNVDYNKHNIVKYLANNKDKDIWKMSKRPSIRIHLQSRTRTNLRRILLNLYYKRERNISVRQLFRKKNN